MEFFTQNDSFFQTSDWALILGRVLALILTAIVVVRVVSWRKKGSLSDEEIEALDPLMLTYLYRKSLLRYRHFTIGLVSLSRRGVLTMKQVPSKPRYRYAEKAPNHTLEFRKTGTSVPLSEDERWLMDSLFGENGKRRSFRLDDLAGPAGPQDGLEERNYYRAKKRALKRAFREWRTKVGQRDELKEMVRKSIGLRLFVWSLALILIVAVLAVQAEPSGWDENGMFWNVAISAVALMASIKVKSRGWFVAMILIGTLVVGVEPYPYPSGQKILAYALLATIPVRLMLPIFTVTPEYRNMYHSIRRWRSTRFTRLAKTAESDTFDADKIERSLQCGLALDVLHGVAAPLRGSDGDGKRAAKPNEQQYPLLALSFAQPGELDDFKELQYPYSWSDEIQLNPGKDRKRRRLRMSLERSKQKNP